MVKRRRCRLCNHEDRDNLEAQLETMAIGTDDLDKQMSWPSGTSSRHQRNHMGDYVDASNPRCSLCTHELRQMLEEQISEGKTTPAAASKLLQCSEEQVKRHMRKHLQPLVQKSAANIIAMKEVDEIDSLSKNITRLEAST